MALLLLRTVGADALGRFKKTLSFNGIVIGNFDDTISNYCGEQKGVGLVRQIVKFRLVAQY